MQRAEVPPRAGKSPYPPPKCIAIDVDGTLIDAKGQLNRPLVEWARMKKAQGFEVILWTARGRQHAEQTAKQHRITACFTAIIGKPGFIVDDLGWDWIQYSIVLEDSEAL